MHQGVLRCPATAITAPKLCSMPMQHVDFFDMDYVFMPYHKGVHWSLVVVCHPGQLLQPPTDADDDADEGEPSRTACILHLDSLPGTAVDDSS
jgi:Ulp1 family protease